MRIQLTIDGDRIGDLYVKDDGKIGYDGDETVLRPMAERYARNLVELEGTEEVTAEDVLGSMLDNLQGRMAATKVSDFPEGEEDDDGEGEDEPGKGVGAAA